MSLNWPQLVAQGRAKDIGIAWNDEEHKALAILTAHTGLERNVVARFIREGILTAEEYDAAKATGNEPATRKQLETAATEAGVEFAPETPDTVLEAATTKAKKSTKTK